MQTQLQFIIDLAKQFHDLSTNNALLFKTLHNLPTTQIESVYKEYGDPENKFKPVNLLRAELALKLIKGETISELIIEEIKQKIRSKELEYFSHLPNSYLEEIQNYTIGKRDMFANWQRPWSIFYPFFYRNAVSSDKRMVQSYLELIAKDLLQQLGLEDYTYHCVDFQGANNFGSDQCWLALYPITKESHQESYQLFLKISVESEAGIYPGPEVKNKKATTLQKIVNYVDILNVLKSSRDKVVQYNNESKNYFKIAPGNQASEWNRFYDNEIIAIDFSIPDLNNFKTREEINGALGLTNSPQANRALNIWLFKSAKVGDVVFATKGINVCLGIGLIEGKYVYNQGRNNFQHTRQVKWITNKVYQYESYALPGYKTLFRPDTFSPTHVHEFLLQQYILLYPELEDIFHENNLLDKEEISKSKKTVLQQQDQISNEEIEPINFWWLNANPKIWSISNHAEGQRQTYTTHNEKGNKRRIYKYFEASKPGDLIIGYESTPTKQIKAIYEVTKGIHNTDVGEEIEFELVEKLEIPVAWNDIKNNPGLQKCEVLINNQGSLFRLSEEEFDILREIIDNKNILTEKFLQTSTQRSYNFKEDQDKPFISETDFFQTVQLLKRKKNIILQGPPGVGKTFIARKIAYEIMGEVKDANIEMVQFHQSYSYEDFVQGLRPVAKGGFDLRDGVFYSFCQRALAHPERLFFFIIDEINRGNLSKIFGELMMLIEADKREEKFALKLTYAEDEEDRFYVPDNLYIIGTMNTADRSLAIVDYALRRRFAFVTMQPDYGHNFRSFLTAKGVSNTLVDHVCSSVSKVNDKIKADINLGEGFQIGHSYFCSYTRNEDENTWWNDILNFELKPLLEEIWFDDLSKVTEMLKQLSR